MQRAFHTLCRDAAACRLCPRLADKHAVLSELNGSLTPRVLFIGEAPGRRGAERTRRPFTGDKSGDAFDALLAHAGLRRDEIFITNAVLCCPADDSRNHSPTAGEIRNCQPFLQRTIELLRPAVVATLGAVALRAINPLVRESLLARSDAGIPSRKSSPARTPGRVGARTDSRTRSTGQSLKLREHAGTPIELERFTLVPLYHPSPRVLNTVRSRDEQQADMLVLAETLATARHIT